MTTATKDGPAEVLGCTSVSILVALRSDKVKILFLSANPVDVVARLRSDQEFREIREKICRGNHGNQLELVSELALRVGDLQAALLRHQPDIVHFSGHCSQTSGIVLEDENGNRKTVSRKALSDLFSILKGNIRLVVLNACYAKDQAQALIGTIDCAIGMNDAIEDKAALIFAAHFYQSLAFGCSVKKAFKLALNQFEIEGIDRAHVPELLVRDGADPSKIRIIKQSRPPVEPRGKAAAVEERRVALAEDLMQPSVFHENNPGIVGSESVMRGLDDDEPQGKHRPVAFLPWLFASVAIILTTDVSRRFLGGAGGWMDIAATIVQLVFFIFATTALLLLVISLLRPINSFVQIAVRSGIFTESPKAQGAAILSGIALVITFGLWWSLPVFAQYYNERGIRFQYGEPPDLSRARESYQQAVRLNPSYAPAHYNLAFVQEDLHPEKAMEEYLLAIRYDSHMYAAYNNLARLYLLRGQGNDYEHALNILNQAEALSPPDVNVQYSLNKNLGWANYLLKHYPLAETYLRRVISLRSQGAAAHCLLAYVLKEQGKAGVVDECYDCVSLAPGEKDIEAKWVSDAKDCLTKGGRQ
jgi:tetratricopeptide (TPR) repeat protein